METTTSSNDKKDTTTIRNGRLNGGGTSSGSKLLDPIGTTPYTTTSYSNYHRMQTSPGKSHAHSNNTNHTKNTNNTATTTTTNDELLLQTDPKCWHEFLRETEAIRRSTVLNKLRQHQLYRESLYLLLQESVIETETAYRFITGLTYAQQHIANLLLEGMNPELVIATTNNDDETNTDPTTNGENNGRTDLSQLNNNKNGTTLFTNGTTKFDKIDKKKKKTQLLQRKQLQQKHHHSESKIKEEDDEDDSGGSSGNSSSHCDSSSPYPGSGQKQNVVNNKDKDKATTNTNTTTSGIRTPPPVHEVTVPVDETVQVLVEQHTNLQYHIQQTIPYHHYSATKMIQLVQRSKKYSMKLNERMLDIINQLERTEDDVQRNWDTYFNLASVLFLKVNSKEYKAAKLLAEKSLAVGDHNNNKYTTNSNMNNTNPTDMYTYGNVWLAELKYRAAVARQLDEWVQQGTVLQFNFVMAKDAERQRRIQLRQYLYTSIQQQQSVYTKVEQAHTDALVDWLGNDDEDEDEEEEDTATTTDGDNTDRSGGGLLGGTTNHSQFSTEVERELEVQLNEMMQRHHHGSTTNTSSTILVDNHLLTRQPKSLVRKRWKDEQSLLIKNSNHSTKLQTVKDGNEENDDNNNNNINDDGGNGYDYDNNYPNFETYYGVGTTETGVEASDQNTTTKTNSTRSTSTNTTTSNSSSSSTSKSQSSGTIDERMKTVADRSKVKMFYTTATLATNQQSFMNSHIEDTMVDMRNSQPIATVAVPFSLSSRVAKAKASGKKSTSKSTNKDAGTIDTDKKTNSTECDDNIKKTNPTLGNEVTPPLTTGSNLDNNVDAPVTTNDTNNITLVSSEEVGDDDNNNNEENLRLSMLEQAKIELERQEADHMERLLYSGALLDSHYVQYAVVVEMKLEENDGSVTYTKGNNILYKRMPRTSSSSSGKGGTAAVVTTSNLEDDTPKLCLAVVTTDETLHLFALPDSLHIPNVVPTEYRILSSPSVPQNQDTTASHTGSGIMKRSSITGSSSATTTGTKNTTTPIQLGTKAEDALRVLLLHHQSRKYNHQNVDDSGEGNNKDHNVSPSSLVQRNRRRFQGSPTKNDKNENDSTTTNGTNQLQPFLSMQLNEYTVRMTKRGEFAVKITKNYINTSGTTTRADQYNYNHNNLHITAPNLENGYDDNHDHDSNNHNNNTSKKQLKVRLNVSSLDEQLGLVAAARGQLSRLEV